MNKEKCVVIIVTYNGKKWYDKCFQSLLSSSVPLDIIVVDNKSTDDTVDYIEKNYPSIKIIKNETNYGFARGNNIGLRAGYENNAEFYFLLNQDAWVEYNTVEELIKFSKNNPEYGILSPIHLTGNKEHFDRKFRIYFNQSCDMSHAYENLFLKKLKNNHYDTFFVNAAAWMITKKCIEIVGGFDTIMLKHYGEDNNYCRRVIYHHLKIAIVTSVTICHDREYRQKKKRDINIRFSETYANVLLGKREYLKHLIEVVVGIMSLRHPRSGIKELIFLIKNAKKIKESRQIGKTVGAGMKFIFDA